VRRIAGIAALAVVLGGCGGSYTKHDFIASADAICASTVRATRALAPPASAQLGPFGRYLAKLVPILQDENRQIDALRRPTGGRAPLRRYLDALRESVVEFRALEAAAKAGNPESLARAQEALRSNPVTSLAANYGLRSCAAPGATVS
jgi:hypothetical protein